METLASLGNSEKGKKLTQIPDINESNNDNDNTKAQ